MNTEPHIFDRVAITCIGGFDGRQGVLEYIDPPDPKDDEYAYGVNFGWSFKYSGYFIVPFRRDEVEKVVRHE